MAPASLYRPGGTPQATSACVRGTSALYGLLEASLRVLVAPPQRRSPKRADRASRRAPKSPSASTTWSAVEHAHACNGCHVDPVHLAAELRQRLHHAVLLPDC